MNYGLPSASNFAPAIDHLSFALISVCSFFILLVCGLILFFCIRYRKNQKNVDRASPPLRNPKLEYSLIAVIFIFGMVTFSFSARMFYRMYLPPENAREVFGVAKQWMWIFHDPNGKDQINEFTIPVNTPVKLTLISEDVIHSLYIPAFRVKQDVLPNRYTSLWFTATKVGDYPLFCTQFCGLSHSEMLATVHVVAKMPNTGPELTLSSRPRGEKLFQEKGCASCHLGGDRQANLGPEIRGIYGMSVTLENGQTVKVDDAYLRESIVNPSAKIVKGYPRIMPTYQGILSETEINDLIDYIKHWKGNAS